jgi:hypothetical protein
MTKLSTSAKAGLLGGVLVIAIAAGWFLLIAPKRSEASKLQTQIADTRAQIVAARTPVPRHQTSIRVADLFELSRAMPNRVDMPNVLLQLADVAAATGITFDSITPSEPVPLGSFEQIQINLVFEGHFYDLSDFLYRLRNLVGVHRGVLDATGRLFAVDSISFGQGSLTFPQVKASLTVSAYVFGDGTAAPVPSQATSGQSVAASAASTTEGARPIPPAPAGSAAAGS